MLVRNLLQLGLLAGWTGLLLGSVEAESLTTIVDNGPSENRVDIVFLGDGFTSDQLDDYAEVVDGMLSHLFQDEVFSRYQDYFNVHRIDVVSQESGADIPAQDVFVNTALGARYSSDAVTGGFLYIDEALANRQVDASLGPLGIFPDLRLVAVNGELLGGGSAQYSVFSSRQVSSFEVGLHEIGHAFSGLADEYIGPQGVGRTFQGAELQQANVTIDPTGSKWQHWIGYEQEGIGVIGAYEGGFYFEKGVYRPSEDSKMRTLFRPFDVVAREQIILDIYSHVDPLDAWRDETVAVTDERPLWVRPLDEETISLEWNVNGEVVEGATSNQLDLFELGLRPGTYFVGVTARDDTDWVRRDETELLQQIFWVVSYFPGDFDDNQSVDVADIDALTEAVRADSSDPRFDINHDGVVSAADRDRWVMGAGSHYGDANLDGTVSFPDFVALSANYGTDAMSWSEGNFDVEPGVGFGDFLLLSANFGQPSPVAAAIVPEPNAQWLLVAMVFALPLFRTRKRAEIGLCRALERQR